MTSINQLPANLFINSVQPSPTVAKSNAPRQGDSRRPDPFAAEEPDALICFSHLRWNFVCQRPQHLLNRASQQWTVWFVEEPVWGPTLRLEVREVTSRLRVVVPHLPEGIDEETATRLQRQFVDQLLEKNGITDFVSWYYTPMALLFTDHLRPDLIVYDCMDELSAFKGASPQLLRQEERLLNRADLVFTGGHSLYEAKKDRHARVYAFPSCIDYEHFAQACQPLPEPLDQQGIAGPRLGFCGVIDERLDIRLLGELAVRRPDWQFILLGPVVKIDPATLPQGPNLHYLGMKGYHELPAYFSHWQAALLPFAISDATRFLSPTKTPEYLAAGLPVISTPIQDVVRSYGHWQLVAIADSAATFEQAMRLRLTGTQPTDMPVMSDVLQHHSWDTTWQCMHQLMENQLQQAFR